MELYCFHVLANTPLTLKSLTISIPSIPFKIVCFCCTCFFLFIITLNCINNLIPGNIHHLKLIQSWKEQKCPNKVVKLSLVIKNNSKEMSSDIVQVQVFLKHQADGGNWTSLLGDDCQYGFPVWDTGQIVCCHCCLTIKDL